MNKAKLEKYHDTIWIGIIGIVCFGLVAYIFHRVGFFWGIYDSVVGKSYALPFNLKLSMEWLLQHFKISGGIMIGSTLLGTLFLHEKCEKFAVILTTIIGVLLIIPPDIMVTTLGYNQIPITILAVIKGITIGLIL